MGALESAEVPEASAHGLAPDDRRDGRSSGKAAAAKSISIHDVQLVHRVHGSHECYVRVLVWDSFREQLISGGGDGWIRMWSTSDYAQRAELDAKLSVRSLLVLATELASGHSNGEVLLWNLDRAGHPVVQVLQAHREAVYALALLPGGELVTGAEDIRVFSRWTSVLGFQQVRVLAEEVLCMTALPRSARVITGDMNSLLHVWDGARDWTEEARCHGHERSVWAVCYVPDAHRIASGSADHTLRIWDPGTWRCERVLRDHVGWVVGLCSSPGFLLSCSNDHTVRLWDLEAWRCLRCLEDQAYEVYCVAFLGAGRLAAAGAECDIVVYGGPEDVVHGDMPPVDRRCAVPASTEAQLTRPAERRAQLMAQSSLDITMSDFQPSLLAGPHESDPRTQALDTGSAGVPRQELQEPEDARFEAACAPRSAQPFRENVLFETVPRCPGGTRAGVPPPQRLERRPGGRGAPASQPLEDLFQTRLHAAPSVNRGTLPQVDDLLFETLRAPLSVGPGPAKEASASDSGVTEWSSALLSHGR